MNVACVVRTLLVALAALLPLASSAQAWPTKPVRLIVPTSPGGLNDLLSRSIAQVVSEANGQPVLVENRPSAGSIVGMEACARAAPDGHTVCVTTSEPLVLNPLLFTRLPYDPDNDFALVTQLAFTFGVVVATGSLPASTFPEVIALAKAKPGTLNWATWGAASPPAVYLDWINRANGVSITPIPYKGAGPSVPAIVSGEVQLTYTGIGLVTSHIKSGKVKALAVIGTRRLPFLPGVPAIAEFNSDPGLSSYFAMYTQAKVPPPVVERISAEFAKAMRTQKLQDIMQAQAMEAVGNTPAEFAKFHAADRANAARIYKTLGIKPSDAPKI
jgi:tripartite-type tricarboxylate transporter receptor subunit TctC